MFFDRSGRLHPVNSAVGWVATQPFGAMKREAGSPGGPRRGVGWPGLRSAATPVRVRAEPWFASETQPAERSGGSMDTMHRTPIAAAAVLLGAVLSSRDAASCSCETFDVDKQVKIADAVFVGTPIQRG